MTQITVQAQTAVMGLRHGETDVVEDTPFVRKVIAGGRLRVIEPAGSAAPTPAPGRRRRRTGEQAGELVEGVVLPPLPQAGPGGVIDDDEADDGDPAPPLGLRPYPPDPEAA